MDQWTVAVLGDGGVGKTALAVQFTLNCFLNFPILAETYDPTIEDAYRKRYIVDNRMCFVEVIDTAGQEEYATLRDPWIQEGRGFILVYSIASWSTFNRLEVFRQSVRRAKRGAPILMLVGNKCDKAFEREVSKEEGAALVRQFGCEFTETSAKKAKTWNVSLRASFAHYDKRAEWNQALYPISRRSALSCRDSFLDSIPC
ncbi:Ras protein [Mycena venus]|uniref:Ras protein n=1 Tax=Mycena venus TaxID=2733690 RepID=A0A8H6XUC9_9AGAR|nr:Ras protein [Mycena venus]